MRRRSSSRFVALPVMNSPKELETYKAIYPRLKSWFEKPIQKQSTNSKTRFLINWMLLILTSWNTQRFSTTLPPLISNDFLWTALLWFIETTTCVGYHEANSVSETSNLLQELFFICNNELDSLEPTLVTTLKNPANKSKLDISLKLHDFRATF